MMVMAEWWKGDDSVEALRETVKNLVSDVTELKINMKSLSEDTSTLKMDVALTRQAQETFRQNVTEYMTRSDLGRVAMNTKLDQLLNSDIQWAFVRKLFTIGWSGVLGLAAILAAWSAWVQAKSALHW